MRSRKHKEEEHVDSHRWVVSYADFITLLFAFFVVMYAISSVNVSKYKTLAKGMESAFNNKTDQPASRALANPIGGMRQLTGKGGQEYNFDAMSQALTKLQDSDYKMSSKDGRIQFDISAGALFRTGSVEVKPMALIKLMELANILKGENYPILLTGHTDNLPINTPQFPSNWELSAARAASIARILNSFGVDAERITVTGYGAQRPIADNNTPDGRKKNRRVNLVIFRDKVINTDEVPVSGKKLDNLEGELIMTKDAGGGIHE